MADLRASAKAEPTTLEVAGGKNILRSLARSLTHLCCFSLSLYSASL